MPLIVQSGRDSLPLERRKWNVNIKKSEIQSFTVQISGIHELWVQNKDTLMYVSPPQCNEHEEYDLGDKETWLKQMKLYIRNLKWLLNLPYHKFWSQMIYHESTTKTVMSYLYSACRPENLVREFDDIEITAIVSKVHRLIFRILKERLLTPKETKANFMNPKFWGTLLFNEEVVVWGNILDICTLYGEEHNNEVIEMLNTLLKCNRRYLIQLLDYIPFLFGRLFEAEQKLNAVLSDVVSELNQISTKNCDQFIDYDSRDSDIEIDTLLQHFDDRNCNIEKKNKDRSNTNSFEYDNQITNSSSSYDENNYDKGRTMVKHREYSDSEDDDDYYENIHEIQNKQEANKFTSGRCLIKQIVENVLILADTYAGICRLLSTYKPIRKLFHVSRIEFHTARFFETLLSPVSSLITVINKKRKHLKLQIMSDMLKYDMMKTFRISLMSNIDLHYKLGLNPIECYMKHMKKYCKYKRFIHAYYDEFDIKKDLMKLRRIYPEECSIETNSFYEYIKQSVKTNFPFGSNMEEWPSRNDYSENENINSDNCNVNDELLECELKRGLMNVLREYRGKEKSSVNVIREVANETLPSIIDNVKYRQSVFREYIENVNNHMYETLRTRLFEDLPNLLSSSDDEERLTNDFEQSSVDNDNPNDDDNESQSSGNFFFFDVNSVDTTADLIETEDDDRKYDTTKEENEHEINGFAENPNQSEEVKTNDDDDDDDVNNDYKEDDDRKYDTTKEENGNKNEHEINGFAENPNQSEEVKTNDDDDDDNVNNDYKEDEESIVTIHVLTKIPEKRENFNSDLEAWRCKTIKRMTDEVTENYDTNQEILYKLPDDEYMANEISDGEWSSDDSEIDQYEDIIEENPDDENEKPFEVVMRILKGDDSYLHVLSLIQSVKDIFPHLGDGFIKLCLDYYNFNTDDVVDAIVQEQLPDSLLESAPDLRLIIVESESNDILEEDDDVDEAAKKVVHIDQDKQIFKQWMQKDRLHSYKNLLLNNFANREARYVRDTALRLKDEAGIYCDDHDETIFNSSDEEELDEKKRTDDEEELIEELCTGSMPVMRRNFGRNRIPRTHYTKTGRNSDDDSDDDYDDDENYHQDGKRNEKLNFCENPADRRQQAKQSISTRSQKGGYRKSYRNQGYDRSNGTDINKRGNNDGDRDSNRDDDASNASSKVNKNVRKTSVNKNKNPLYKRPNYNHNRRYLSDRKRRI